MKIDTVEKKLGSYLYSYGSNRDAKVLMIGCVIFLIKFGLIIHTNQFYKVILSKKALFFNNH